MLHRSVQLNVTRSFYQSLHISFIKNYCIKQYLHIAFKIETMRLYIIIKSEIYTKIQQKLKMHQISLHALKAIIRSTYSIDTKVSRYQPEVDVNKMQDCLAERTLGVQKFTNIGLSKVDFIEIVSFCTEHCNFIIRK